MSSRRRERTRVRPSSLLLGVHIAAIRVAGEIHVNGEALFARSVRIDVEDGIGRTETGKVTHQAILAVG